MDIKNNSLFLTPKEAAEKLNVHLNTIYNMMNTGKLPIIQIYNRKYILTEKVNEYISEQIKKGRAISKDNK